MGAFPTPIPASNIFDRSGVIAAGNTSQQLVAANPHRRRLTIQNPSTAALQGIGGAESIFINFTGPAVVAGGGGNIEIQPGTSWDESENCYGGAVNIIATTINHKFTCIEG